MSLYQRLRQPLVRCSALLSIVLLCACSITKLDTRQGNFISQDMIDKLKTGMNKSEVQHVMGTPAITPVVNLDRWDYIYLLQPGKDSLQPTHTQLTLFFKNDKLQSYTGDWAPKHIPKRK